MPINCNAPRGEGRQTPSARGSIIPDRIRLYQVKSDRGFSFSIAITIPIKIVSGKIRDRFSDQIRSAILPEKSDPDLQKKNDP